MSPVAGTTAYLPNSIDLESSSLQTLFRCSSHRLIWTVPVMIPCHGVVIQKGEHIHSPCPSVVLDSRTSRPNSCVVAMPSPGRWK